MVKTDELRGKKPNYKTDCYVCGKYKTITEWHHEIPLGHLAEYFFYYLEEEPDIFDKNRLFCVCPNCHAYIHKILKTENQKDMNAIFMDELSKTYSIKEARKFTEIIAKMEEL